MTRANIDDLIHGITPTPKEEDVKQDAPEALSESEASDNKTEGEVQESKTVEKPSEEDENESTPLAAEDKDEYGNEVQKSRMYSEEDVQRMIRDRLSRGNNNYTPQQNEQIQKAAENFTVDPNNTDSWELQLKQFIKGTLEEVKTEEKTRDFQHREKQKQADFESRFTTSMERYKDFRDVVSQVPITDSMMMATRDMKDPAAFVYAVSKQHPEELKRIASLQDPYQQAVEVGRLEERMKKTRAMTKAPAPLSTQKGDVTSKDKPKYNIDQRIHQYGKVRVR